MRATVTLFAVVAALGVGAQPADAARAAFEDNKLHFKSCDGKNLVARWRDNNFHISVPGRVIEPQSPELTYLDWQGVCRRLSVDGKGRFIHAGETSDPRAIFNYVGWDDTKWAATRAGTGFYQVYVAGKDEATTGSQLREAALFLSTHKPESRAAALLARELRSEAEK